MKKLLLKGYLALSLIISLWSMLYLPTYADGGCIFWFWEDCYVKEIKTIGTEKKQESALLDTIKSTINWILGILATIALVICMYGWFKMLTSGWNSKWYDDWLKVLQNAALWLVIIWLSRLIVSAIIWFIQLQTWWNSTIG